MLRSSQQTLFISLCILSSLQYLNTPFQSQSVLLYLLLFQSIPTYFICLILHYLFVASQKYKNIPYLSVLCYCNCCFSKLFQYALYCTTHLLLFRTIIPCLICHFCATVFVASMWYNNISYLSRFIAIPLPTTNKIFLSCYLQLCLAVVDLAP